MIVFSPDNTNTTTKLCKPAILHLACGSSVKQMFIEYKIFIK